MAMATAKAINKKAINLVENNTAAIFFSMKVGIRYLKSCTKVIKKGIAEAFAESICVLIRTDFTGFTFRYCGTFIKGKPNLFDLTKQEEILHLGIDVIR